MGLRYLLMMALGSAIYKRLNKDENKIIHPIALSICFIIGYAYIAFFSVNRENIEIFRYTSWGNTNVFSCLYIAPLFYVAMALFGNSRIKPEWFHKLTSAIGQSSYYILCTQMVMFWVIGKFWNWAAVPLVVIVVGNVVLAVASGVGVNIVVDKIKNKILDKNKIISK